MSWAWSPYEFVRPSIYSLPLPTPSTFFERQLEYIRPGLFEVEQREIKSMKLIPVSIELGYKPGGRVEHIGLVNPPRPYRTVRGNVPIPVEVPARVLRANPEDTPLHEEILPSGVRLVSGTYKQICDYFKARGCNVAPKGPSMRDASRYAIWYGTRYITEFVQGWRGSGRTTLTYRWLDGRDPGDE